MKALLKPVFFGVFAFVLAVISCSRENPSPTPEPKDEVEWEDAVSAVRNMGAGWNLGNTLDSTITLHDSEKWDPSTGWTGFDVDSAWMVRVKTIVDYVMDEGMYCILNVHHDTGAANTAWLVASDANVRFASYFSQKAKDAGAAAFWWMGLSDGNDRSTPAWTMPKTKDAILKAYKSN